MSVRPEKMAKKSIGSLMRKKLSDITNSHSHYHSQQDNINHHPISLDNYPSDKDCIHQLLKERATLIQLLAERNKMIERNGAELQKLRANIKKMQLQNWSLAQSNTLMLAELNLGREKIKTLQHEILWRAALIKGNTLEAQEKVEIAPEKNVALSQIQEGDEKATQPSHKARNDEQHRSMNRRRISRSTGSSTAPTKNASKDKAKENRRPLRRHSSTFKTHEHEALENLFEIEDAQYAITQSGPNMLSSTAVKTELGQSSVLRNEAPRHSFGRPLRSAVGKINSYKEVPLNVKMRRLV